MTGESNPNFAYGYVAEAIEVEINKKTGKIKINKVHCADDVGKAINPLQVKGQIEGAVVQATGYAMLENFVQEYGYVVIGYLGYLPDPNDHGYSRRN